MFSSVATMEDLGSGARHQLAARHVVGRSRSCHLRIATSSVSGLHAQIVWDEGGWQIQDLGSRNGTFVGKRRLGPGELAALSVGAEVMFGVTDNRFRLIDDSPPRLMAIADNGDLCMAEDELLCLPSLDVAEVTVFRDATQRWIAETVENSRAIEDQESLIAGGRAWRVCLPARLSRTRDSDATLDISLAEVELEFRISRDGEDVRLALTHETLHEELEARAHMLLLSTLAQARLDDARTPELAQSEHGWLYRDQLIEMLKIDGQLLNLWVYRSRCQLMATKIRGAAGIIERRQSTHQMRIGASRLVITRA